MRAVIHLNDEEERALIKRASRGDLDAFNQLVLSYQGLAYHCAYTLTGDADLAEDITQESFIKAFTKISGFRGDSLRAWLLKIVTKTAYDHLRQIKRHSARALSLKDANGDEIESHPWLVDPGASVEAIVDVNERSRRLYQMLDELPENFRSVIMLVDIYELSYAEASEILKVPMGTVKSRLTRARLKMMRKLQDENEPLFAESPPPYTPVVESH